VAPLTCDPPFLLSSSAFLLYPSISLFFFVVFPTFAVPRRPLVPASTGVVAGMLRGFRLVSRVPWGILSRSLCKHVANPPSLFHAPYTPKCPLHASDHVWRSSYFSKFPKPTNTDYPEHIMYRFFPFQFPSHYLPDLSLLILGGRPSSD